MESNEQKYTRNELIAAMASRLIEDRKTVFVGVGLPVIAASLAQKLHAPHLTMIFEGGSIGAQIRSEYVPFSTNEARVTCEAFMLTSTSDIFLFQQRGFIDCAVIGCAQIDKYGNVNSSLIGTQEKPKVRLPGSGGANDIASAASNIIIVTTHEKRKFVEKVDFITSPGYINESISRKEAGLLFGRVYKIVTDLAELHFDKRDKKMILDAIHPGVTVDYVINNTGFELAIPKKVKITKSPTKRELDTLRTLDPERRYIA